MARVIAVTNQKGGVGKTTTALNLGAGLREKGYRVLFVDMDPQCSLTYTMGGSYEQITVCELLLGQRGAAEAVQTTAEGDLIAASPNLSGMDYKLNQTGKEYRLREALTPMQTQYDYIIIDSPPTLGVLTINILTAASGMVIPALADVFSLQGVGQLFATIQAVRTYCNPALQVCGILLVRHNDRYILSREMREMLEDTAGKLGTKVYSASIREAVALREAQAGSMDIFRYAPKCRQAADYAAFTEEFLRG